MKATDFLQTVKKINRIDAVQSHGSMNAFLLSGYQIQTGQTVFRTFRKWKEAGWNVRKGESSFPIFSRPIGIIKSEQGKEFSEDELKYFGVCHLFHAGQVDKISEDAALINS